MKKIRFLISMFIISLRFYLLLSEYLDKFQHIKLSDLNQPLLRTSGRNKQRIYLVPEVCLISEMYTIALHQDLVLF